MFEWICVDEMLPEDNKSYLVYIPLFEDIYDCFYVAEYIGDAKWRLFGFVLDNITHWMPLPSPPEEETTDEH